VTWNLCGWIGILDSFESHIIAVSFLSSKELCKIESHSRYGFKSSVLVLFAGALVEEAAAGGSIVLPKI
jgi:hypothetical protein